VTSGGHRNTPRRRILRRLLAHAQGRARVRLSHAHPEEYRAYYEEEKIIAREHWLTDEERTTLES
jgi:hypothetical protein